MPSIQQTEPTRKQQTAADLVITDAFDEIAMLRDDNDSLRADLAWAVDLVRVSVEMIRTLTMERNSARRQSTALRDELRAVRQERPAVRNGERYQPNTRKESVSESASCH